MIDTKTVFKINDVGENLIGGEQAMWGKKLVAAVLVSAVLALSFQIVSEAATEGSDTGIGKEVVAVGQYINWDGVSNVAQFKGTDGNLWFAVDSDTTVTIYKTSNGVVLPGSISLKKQHALFGTALCDSNGNFYVVTGEENSTDDTTVETVFISKYNSSGKLLGTVGDNGSSSLSRWYDDGFYTKIPFNGGGCDATISGDLLTVHYARKMYNGHQSNSIFTVDIDDLSKSTGFTFYESHSFAQRVIPTDNGFVFMSEGDCYERCFKLYAKDLVHSKTNEYSVFDFWVEDGASDQGNMWVLNNNFAHMGGITLLSNGNVAFAAASAKSLSSSAKTESEEIFLQIFDPFGDLSTKGAYVTSGSRSGLAGGNGRDQVTNYGVKWLTSLGTDYGIDNVQIVSTDDKKIIVLYECGKTIYRDEYGSESEFEGTYYMVLDESGNVIKSATLFSNSARLNPCESPVYKDGKVYWVGNTDGGSELYTFTLDPTKKAVILSQSVKGVSDLTYNGTAQKLVNPGTAEGGTFVYAVGDGSKMPALSQYSTTVPTGTNAGKYSVYYYLKGDSGYVDTIPKKAADVTIAKQRVTITQSPRGIRDLHYDEHRRQELVTPGTVSAGEMLYAVNNTGERPDDSAYSTNIPIATAPGTFYVFYKGQDNDNYYSLNSGCVSVTVGEPLHLSWYYEDGKWYWYEYGSRQGTVDDPKGVKGDGTVRGREIYDSESDGWYWLDAVYGGAKAIGKEVWMPYIYQNEDEWDDAQMRQIANESDPGMEDLVYNFMREKQGKWVRYDENGRMLKGWVFISGALAEKYPDQVGNIYYYDTRTGLMAKGLVTIDGDLYYFDEVTGALIW